MEYGRLGKAEPGAASTRVQPTDLTPKPKITKLRLLLLAAALVMVAAIISAAIAVVIRKKSDSAQHNRRPSQAISRACSHTLHPSLCLNSLLEFPGALTASDKDLTHISVNLTLQKVGRSLYVASEIANLDMDSHVRFVRIQFQRFQLKFLNYISLHKMHLAFVLKYYLRSAYEDCLELLDHSVDLLTRSLTSVAPDGEPSGSTRDVLTWLSASLTNHDTCIEGFDELNGNVKNQMSDRLKDLSELASNSLAIYSASAAVDDDLADIPIQTRRRRLLSDEKEREQFPVWLSRRERMLLDMPASAINADIVVAKDGNGTFKTIAEAIKKAPDHSSRRFIIYVRAGR